MTRIFFGDKKVQKAYEDLKGSEFQDLYKHIQIAFKDIKNDPFASGIPIEKRLIPKYYIKRFGVNNLMKYDLPMGWRLLYSVGQEGIEVIAIVLEWMRHKDYERRFKY